MKDGFLKSDDLAETIRQSGMRVTPQRVAVLEAVLASGTHLSAEDVYEDVRRKIPTISLGTVYKALGELRDVGQVRAVQVSGKLRFDGGAGPHSHLVCQRCHRIEDVGPHAGPGAWDDLGIDLPEDARLGYQILGVEISFWGICPDCREQSALGRASKNTRANGKAS